ncbi:uncharacterized protein LOC126840336 [Adelges cooleyi]|uniref:uncharacterized protein LOC126840336 n=1 Tax=Adelges cooleyi TaxID=133065 RepID=UPI00217FA1D8|nr:uncharacterized protein LOC126840336 [Adelges cooleyi]
MNHFIVSAVLINFLVAAANANALDYYMSTAGSMTNSLTSAIPLMANSALNMAKINEYMNYMYYGGLPLPNIPFASYLKNLFNNMAAIRDLYNNLMNQFSDYYRDLMNGIHSLPFDTLLADKLKADMTAQMKIQSDYMSTVVI